MKLPLLTRRIHYWTAIVAAAPLLVVVVTGILLQLKKEWSWVQPPEKKGSGHRAELSFADILNACRDVPEAEIRTWDDINRIDVRPSKRLVKVTSNNNWEIQIDAGTGEVIQKAYRRSDVIEAIHDGSWFHDRVKLWGFLPAAILLLLLWITGVYLFWLPRYARWRRHRTVPRAS